MLHVASSWYVCSRDELAVLDREITVERVETDRQKLLVAQIRNICRAGFSHDRTSRITRDAQLRWWAAQGPRLQAWLWLDGDLVPVGFGMLRPLVDTDRLVAVCAVLPEARGRHYGLAIMRFLVHEAGERIASTAAIDNPAAVKLHDPGHWVEVRSAEPTRLRAFESRLTGVEARIC